MIRWLILLAALFGLATPALADDITATGRGVVRVVTIATAPPEKGTGNTVLGFGHGSGFAIAPDRIVTNAHVVELAARYPDNVIIGVVPSEGQKSYRGKLIAYDPQRDLAVIQVTGVNLPVATLFAGPVSEGDTVIALGYPGNVDLATARSAADYILPLSPVRSQGVFSSRRTLSGSDVLLHTASLARGNSGGPLLDRCGRVLGVNSDITKSEAGDASFGFAIADSALAAFLRENKQSFASVGAACISMADRIAQDRDADARAKDSAADAARNAAAQAQISREAALNQARADTERLRENIMALAALMLVTGALALGGAGLLEIKGSRRGAIASAAAGGILIVAAVVTFIFRPASVSEPVVDAMAIPTPALASGKMRCAIVPGRGRVNTSDTGDVLIDWGKAGCMNSRTQYAEAGSGRWERILVPAEEATVSILAFDPASSTYSNTRYLLSQPQMDAARKLRTGVAIKACAADQATRNALSTQQIAIRDALPTLPDEELVYHCRPDSGATAAAPAK